MSNCWKHILKQANDDDLGQTLVRLARQAVAVHMFEMGNTQLESESARGTSPQSMVQSRATDNGTVHLEVDS